MRTSRSLDHASPPRTRSRTVVLALATLFLAPMAHAGVGMQCGDPQRAHEISMLFGTNPDDGLSVMHMYVLYPGRDESEVFWLPVSGERFDFDNQRIDLVARPVHDGDGPDDEPDPRRLHLKAHGAAGVLTLPDREVPITCDWELG